MARSDHAIIFYLSVEGGTLAFLIAIIGSRSPRALEGATRYFLASAMGSLAILYSISCALVCGGPLELWSWSRSALGGLVLVLLIFKLSLFPLHFLFPDIVESSPLQFLPVWLGWMKVFFFVALVKLFSLVGLTSIWGSLLVGAVGVTSQSRLLRGVAYFSINSSGWLVLGASTGLPLPLGFFISFFVLYSLSVHALSNWWRTSALHPGSFMVELGRLAPDGGKFIGVLVLAWLGIPPLISFWWKWEILVSCVSVGGYLTVLISLLCSSLVLFFVLRVIRLISFSALPGRVPLVVSPSSLAASGPILFISLGTFVVWPSLTVILYI